jgi:hypothetical protein
MAWDDYTWFGSIDLKPVEFTGTEAKVSAWAHNLIGQEIRVVGKDGEEYVIGIVTGFLTTSVHGW